MYRDKLLSLEACAQALYYCGKGDSLLTNKWAGKKYQVNSLISQVREICSGFFEFYLGVDN